MPTDLFIPFWGDPDYLKQTVESVLNQTNPDWLLTVVDNAYPDPAVSRYFSGITDPRVKYVRKARNEGITANLRTCVAMATQEVVVILGADDCLLPNYVEVIRAAHTRFPAAAIIQPGVQVIDGNGAIVQPLPDLVKQHIVKPKGRGDQLLCGEALAASLMHGNWLYWPSLAFRTAKLREVDFADGYPVTQDLPLIMDMVFRGAQLLVTPTLCFSYRRHSASASSRALLEGARFADERRYFAVAAAQAGEIGWRRAARAAKWRVTSRAYALSLIPAALSSRNWAAVKALVRHSLGNSDA